MRGSPTTTLPAHLGTLAVLFACVAHVPAAHAEERDRTVAIQPLNMALWPVLSADDLTRPSVLQLPLVLSLGEVEDGEWTFEATWTYLIAPSGVWSDEANGFIPRRTDRASFLMSGGRAFRPMRSGFFILPKAILVVAIEGSAMGDGSLDPPIPAMTTPGLQTSLGVDVGYRWQFERWSLTLVTGGAAGYVWTRGVATRSALASLISPAQLEHRRGLLPANVVLDANFNILRFGWRF